MASSDQVSNTEVVNIFLRLQMDSTSSKEYLAVVLAAKRTYWEAKFPLNKISSSCRSVMNFNFLPMQDAALTLRN